MVDTFIFDETSPYWSNNYDFNKSFIEMQTHWIYDFIKANGYVYLNKIYDTFAVNWSPDESNDCIRYGINDFMLAWRDLGNSRFEIRIYY